MIPVEMSKSDEQVFLLRKFLFYSLTQLSYTGTRIKNTNPLGIVIVY